MIQYNQRCFLPSSLPHQVCDVPVRLHSGSDRRFGPHSDRAYYSDSLQSADTAASTPPLLQSEEAWLFCRTPRSHGALCFPRGRRTAADAGGAGHAQGAVPGRGGMPDGSGVEQRFKRYAYLQLTGFDVGDIHRHSLHLRLHPPVRGHLARHAKRPEGRGGAAAQSGHHLHPRLVLESFHANGGECTIFKSLQVPTPPVPDAQRGAGRGRGVGGLLQRRPKMPGRQGADEPRPSLLLLISCCGSRER